MSAPAKSKNGYTLASYVVGYITSVILTLEAYYLVTHHSLHNNFGLVAAIIALALTQFGVQMYFFLHLGQESKPRWRLMAFGMMVGVVLILVLGSLWIMYNLNYSHQLLENPDQVNRYLNSQDGL